MAYQIYAPEYQGPRHTCEEGNGEWFANSGEHERNMHLFLGMEATQISHS